jgi:hypothetical protein
MNKLLIVLWFAVLLGVLYTLTGCTHMQQPGTSIKNWPQAQHADQLLTCKAACGDKLVKKYTPLDGTCECK